MDPAAGIPTVVWLEPEQAPLVRAVAAMAGLSIVGAGSPSRGRSREVAEAFGARPLDDLRATLASCDYAAAAWIAAAGEFGADGADLEAIWAFRERGGKIATMEPIPASALELAGGGWLGIGGGVGGGGEVELMRFIPRARVSRPVLEAAEVLEAFGPVRAVAFEAWSGVGEGTLGARLLDAMDVVLWLLGEPAMIDAAYVNGAAVGAGLHRLPGESLRGLHGDLTCNCRMADGRAAAVVLSNAAGRWNRSLTLLGAGGRIRVYDDGFEWVAPDGARVDASRALSAGRVESGAAAAAPPAGSGGRSAAAIADALERYLTARETAAPPVDLRRVLAMTGAALLSARTGEGESPATITRMAML